MAEEAVLDLPELDENALLASICKASFADFVREFWSTVCDDPLVWNWHMQFLCDELQEMAERVFRNERKKHDLIINISPGSSKSLIASVMYNAWCWTRKPGLVMISVSYSGELAVDLSRKTRELVKSELYQRCFGDVKISDDQDAKGHFVNTKKGERISASTGGRLTGQHGHIIVVDDPLNPEEAASDAELMATNRWMSETLPSRKKNKKIAPTILIMQRLHEFDPTGARLEKADKIPVKHICLPAELTDDVRPRECRKFYVDGLMDVNRLDYEVLAEFEAQGDYVYAAQFLQSPVPRGGAMFQPEKITVKREAPALVRTVRYWDKAGTQGGGAFTAGTKMGICKEGYFWIIHVRRGQWDSGRREKVIKSIAYEDGIRTVIWVEQEPGSGGKESAEGTVRNLSGFRVRKDKVGKSDGDKEARADAFSSQVNNGNVRMVEGEWNAEFLKELRFFPRSKYKDQVDSAAGAFNKLAVRTVVLGGLRKLKNARHARPKEEDPVEDKKRRNRLALARN